MKALTQSEIREVVAGVAEDEARWRPLVRHDPAQRLYEALDPGDAEFEGRLGLWLICWMDGHDTGFHDHGVSSGTVRVVSGEVLDERPGPGGTIDARTYGAGESFDFGSWDIHRLSHAGRVPAVSIHAYSPPLERMNAYVVGPGGVLRPTEVTYGDELRPLDAAA
ncbi:MAG TPA: hypothetical protein VF517_01445 [Thermoleophilaceae bacterium]|jgi:hypothetical protein